MGLSLPKDSQLRKSWQYQQVYRQGKRVWGKGVTLIYRDNGLGTDRLGLSVGGQRSAVKRNRIKRLLREFYRHHRGLPSQVAKRPTGAPGVDLVIATNQKFQLRGLADIQTLFLPIIAGPASIAPADNRRGAASHSASLAGGPHQPGAPCP